MRETAIKGGWNDFCVSCISYPIFCRLTPGRVAVLVSFYPSLLPIKTNKKRYRIALRICVFAYPFRPYAIHPAIHVLNVLCFSWMRTNAEDRNVCRWSYLSTLTSSFLSLIYVARDGNALTSGMVRLLLMRYSENFLHTQHFPQIHLEQQKQQHQLQQQQQRQPPTNGKKNR